MSDCNIGNCGHCSNCREISGQRKRPAEALARIQSEELPTFDLGILEGILGIRLPLRSKMKQQVSESDEEAAETHAHAMVPHCKGEWVKTSCSEWTAAKKSYLLGCARYRPLVEEMLVALKDVAVRIAKRDPQDLIGVVTVIARAEALLSGTKPAYPHACATCGCEWIGNIGQCPACQDGEKDE